MYKHYSHGKGHHGTKHHVTRRASVERAARRASQEASLKYQLQEDAGNQKGVTKVAPSPSTRTLTRSGEVPSEDV